jgi:two-component system, NarL family, sensor histidine kinase LiaS
MVEGPPQPLPLTRTVETHLYAIGREALANVIRHSRAGNARVRVLANDGVVILEIDDDGCGFDPEETRTGHYGLDSMRSRAAEIGATLSIVSYPDAGTRVRVEAPADANGG